MKNGISKGSLLIAFLLLAEFATAQNAESDGSRLFLTVLLVFVVMIAFTVIVQVADNLLRIEAGKSGANKTGANFSIFPNASELFHPSLPDYVQGESVTVLTKGYDILLEGEAEAKVDAGVKARHYAVQPPNFLGIAPIPKMLVQEGDHVKAGDPIFFNKKTSDIKYVAPVSGKVIAINRGEKRAITEVVIEADTKEVQYRAYEAFDLDGSSREALVAYLAESGIWPLIRQRPYNIVPDLNEVPANIFISTFDTAPLAPDSNLVVAGREAAFQKGLDVLGKLTNGSVYLGLNANGESTPSTAFTQAQGVEKQWFHGAHPAGNVGIQIHHIAPVHANNPVWTLGVQEVITLGAIFTEGRFNAERVVAVAGGQVKSAKYIRTYLGANLGELVSGNLKGGKITRLISGDVLSGEQKGTANFVNAFDDQISAIQEGDYYEMFGWLLPQKATPSISHSFPNFLFSDVRFEADTNTHGEERAFVVTGQYESVLPMDIYPQHLMKSILINDFERMEGLGIYELVEEDIALCEFACTSKQPLQSILRDGLNLMHEQG